MFSVQASYDSTDRQLLNQLVINGAVGLSVLAGKTGFCVNFDVDSDTMNEAVTEGWRVVSNVGSPPTSFGVSSN